MIKKIIVILIVFINGVGICDAQQNPVERQSNTTSDTLKQSFVKIVSASRQIYDTSGDVDQLSAVGDVRIVHDSVYMSCDSVVLQGGNVLRAKGNIWLVKNDSIQIFSDSLLYLKDSMMAYFVGNVVLQDGDRELYTSFLQYDLDRDWAIYTDTALVISDGLEVKSKRGIFHLDEDYVNFYENVTIIGETFDLLSDSLRFYTEANRAEFLSPTIINKDGATIYTERGYYDMRNEITFLYGNAQYKEGGSISTADTIKSDGKMNLTTLIGNAKFSDDDKKGTADKIVINNATDVFELIGNSYYKDKENDISGSLIEYSEQTKNVKVTGRSFYSSPPILISAEQLQFDNDVGQALADGNVIWKDTSAHFEILCDHAFYLDSISFMKAYNDTGKPILINEMGDSDTLFMSGDTLISYTENTGQDTFRFFQAYKNVELFNNEMQAICDSISYSGIDSIFTLYHQPCMWADTSQYIGDTIQITMVDDAIDKVDMHLNGMIIKTEDFIFFDQIKGDTIIAKFVNGEIDRLNVNGNSRSIFHMKDDEDAYLGVNDTSCPDMIFLFEDGELKKVRYYGVQESKNIPMRKVEADPLRILGYQWLIDRRPLSIEDLRN